MGAHPEWGRAPICSKDDQMCEMFAVSATQAIDPVPYLREFFPDSVRHPHGWGLAWWDDAKVHLHKEPVMAVESALLEDLLDEGIEASRLIAHIRNATRGSMTYENCHPFVMQDIGGRTWVIAHNGTVLADEPIEPYRSLQRGETDSERMALLLVDRINQAITGKGSYLGPRERFSVLDETIVELAPGNKLNLVIGDGDCIYAHTNTDQPTLYEWHGDGVALLCSRSIGEGWAPLPSCQLVAYQSGSMAFMGTQHGSSFDNDLYSLIIAHERAGL